MPSQSQKPEKFFFNLHNFDDDTHLNVEDIDLKDDESSQSASQNMPNAPAPEPEPEPEPLPVMYSEEELKKTEQKAFENGKAQGAQEVRKSHEQMIADALSNMAQEIKTLQSQQEAQTLVHGDESVALTIALFEKIFPLYKEAHGLDELKAQMISVLEKQRAQGKIDINISHNIHSEVKKHLKTIEKSAPEVKIILHKDESLSGHTCTMRWTGGGADIDRESLVQNVLDALSNVVDHDEVAQTPSKGHDKSNDDGNTDDAKPHNQDGTENASKNEDITDKKRNETLQSRDKEIENADNTINEQD